MASRAVKLAAPARHRRRGGKKAFRADSSAAARPPAAASAAAVNRSRTALAPERAVVQPAVVPVSREPLGEEERIERAKYVEASPRPRAFEDERFLFPQSYGRNRLRLLIKDPEWLFAHWDVADRALRSLRGELGARVVAVSPLTLRVIEANGGQFSSIFLPAGTRSWYVRTDGRARQYRAELGLTLPSGEFRSLAASNTLTAPGNAPSSEAATHKAQYGRGGAKGLTPADTAAPATPARAAGRPVVQVLPPQPGLIVPATAGGRSRGVKGGASDAFGPRRPR